MSEADKKLITIVTERSLESTLIRALEKCGASGYTITDARGKGHRGKREADWDANSNIRIDIVCDVKVVNAINVMLQERFYDNFAMISYTQDVSVLRPDKF